ncbi:hypothetical protein FRC05_011700 [Tulasnella sp. 425]|nr:hypothetical protein FRC05_011700 [Tulasnella sp. 425]
MSEPSSVATQKPSSNTSAWANGPPSSSVLAPAASVKDSVSVPRGIVSSSSSHRSSGINFGIIDVNGSSGPSAAASAATAAPPVVNGSAGTPPSSKDAQAIPPPSTSELISRATSGSNMFSLLGAGGAEAVEMSQTGSQRGGRNAQEQGPDGWNVAGPTPVRAVSAKAVDLSNFGKFTANSGPLKTMGPSSRFKKDSRGRDTPPPSTTGSISRATSGSNMFSLVGAGGAEAVDAMPKRTPPGTTRKPSIDQAPQAPPDTQRGRARNDTLKPNASRLSQQQQQQQQALRGLEPVAALQHLDNRWDRNRIRVDENSLEFVERKVKGLLKRLTLENFDSVSNQIISWANKSENEKNSATMILVTKLVFEKATDEAHRSEMYARLCRKMMERISVNVQDDSIRNIDGEPVVGGHLFRKYLLNRCQEDFERGWSQKESAQAAAALKAADDKAAAEAASKASGGEDNEPVLYSDEYYALLKAKRQGLGLVRFIGELFKLQMLTERIMHECIKKLLSKIDNPEEEEIESLCELLMTVGQALDTPKAKGHMDIYFGRMQMLAEHPNIASRIRYMLLDVIELRGRSWRLRNAAALGPSTIAQVCEQCGGRNAQEQGPDGWNVAGPTPVRAVPAKAGDRLEQEKGGPRKKEAKKVKREERLRLEEEKKRQKEEARKENEGEERLEKEAEECERKEKEERGREERLGAETKARAGAEEKIRKEVEEAVARLVAEAKAKEREEKEKEKPQAPSLFRTASASGVANPASVSPKPGSTSLPTKPILPPITTGGDRPRMQRPAPGPLELSSILHWAPPTAGSPSALASARKIDDLDNVTYPEGIKTPSMELKPEGDKYKCVIVLLMRLGFGYDRDFLLQLIAICKDKLDELDNLSSLDTVEIERGTGGDDNSGPSFGYTGRNNYNYTLKHTSLLAMRSKACLVLSIRVCNLSGLLPCRILKYIKILINRTPVNIMDDRHFYNTLDSNMCTLQ